MCSAHPSLHCQNLLQSGHSVSGPSDQRLLTVLVDVVVGGEVGEEVLAVWDQAPVIPTVWVEGRRGVRGEPGLLPTLLTVRHGQQHAHHHQLHRTHRLSGHQAYVECRDKVFMIYFYN